MMSPHYRRPVDVAVIEADPTDDGTIPGLYLAKLPDGPASELEGSAALIWREAIRPGPPDLLTRVAAAVELAPDDIRDDVEAFLVDLLDRGLLERIDEDRDRRTRSVE